MNIRQIEVPDVVKALKGDLCRETCAFVVNGFLQVLVSEERLRGQWLYHLSVSHPRRYPTWDEIRDLRYELLPNDRTFAILFPPKEQWVNVHENCFHLYEVPQMHERESLLVLP